MAELSTSRLAVVSVRSTGSGAFFFHSRRPRRDPDSTHNRGKSCNTSGNRLSVHIIAHDLDCNRMMQELVQLLRGHVHQNVNEFFDCAFCLSHVMYLHLLQYDFLLHSVVSGFVFGDLQYLRPFINPASGGFVNVDHITGKEFT